jgi:hypothetical protein
VIETIESCIAVCLILFCAVLPVVILVYATVQRWKGAKRRELNPRFQFFISDLLVATAWIGISGLLIFSTEMYLSIIGIISLPLVAIGLYLGKLWQQCSQRNRLRTGFTYLSVGVLCTVVAMFPLSWLGLMTYMLSQWHGC